MIFTSQSVIILKEGFFSCGVIVVYVCFFFLFKQKSAYEVRISDWSSDVCSSDLGNRRYRNPVVTRARRRGEAKFGSGRRFDRGAGHQQVSRPDRRIVATARGGRSGVERQSQ